MYTNLRGLAKIHNNNGQLALWPRKWIHYNEISISRGFIISEAFNMWAIWASAGDLWLIHNSARSITTGFNKRDFTAFQLKLREIVPTGLTSVPALPQGDASSDMYDIWRKGQTIFSPQVGSARSQKDLSLYETGETTACERGRDTKLKWFTI